MQHRIKMDRARRLSGLDGYPQTVSAVVAALPESLVPSLTAAELAEVMRALNATWHEAQAARSREIVAEGCVWDDRRQRLLGVGEDAVTENGA